VKFSWRIVEKSFIDMGESDASSAERQGQRKHLFKKRTKKTIQE